MSDVVALQTALAGEHAAIYGYGVAGAHLDGSARARATRAETAHRRRRGQLDALLREQGAEPEAAAATYALPRPVRDAGDALLLATELEERLAAVWADAVVELRGKLRRFAAEALQDAAVAAALWRGGSVPFPGLPERSA